MISNAQFQVFWILFHFWKNNRIFFFVSSWFILSNVFNKKNDQAVHISSCSKILFQKTVPMLVTMFFLPSRKQDQETCVSAPFFQKKNNKRNVIYCRIVIWIKQDLILSISSVTPKPSYWIQTSNKEAPLRSHLIFRTTSH